MTDHYAAIFRGQPGILGDIFAQAMPRFNNPVNLKRIIAMIDEEDWSATGVDVKGAAFEGLLEGDASEGKRARANTSPRDRSSSPSRYENLDSPPNHTPD